MLSVLTSLSKTKHTNTHTMTKKQKLELEIMAVKLWFQNFGMPNMSSEKQRVYMSSLLNKLQDKFSKV